MDSMIWAIVSFEFLVIGVTNIGFYLRYKENKNNRILAFIVAYNFFVGLWTYVLLYGNL
jgi:hypothetical protein